MTDNTKKVGDLKDADYNPRSISTDELKALGASMQEFGDLSGIVVNVRSGNTVGGHMRLMKLDPAWTITKAPSTDTTGTVSLGHIDSPFGRWQYREVDWTREKELAANLAAMLDEGAFFDGEGNIIQLTMEEYYDDHESTKVICDQNGPVAEDKMGNAGSKIFYPEGE